MFTVIFILLVPCLVTVIIPYTPAKGHSLFKIKNHAHTRSLVHVSAVNRHPYVETRDKQWYISEFYSRACCHPVFSSTHIFIFTAASIYC